MKTSSLRKLTLSLSVAISIGSYGILRADLGDNNPTGISGEFNGNVTTGCSYDPFTGNAKRQIMDISVPGAVGQAGLTFGRVWNSRLIAENAWHGGWSFSHFWVIDGIDFVPVGQTIHEYTVRFPDGRVEVFNTHQGHYWHAAAGVREQLYAYDLPVNGNPIYLLLPDGGRVEFQVNLTIRPGPPNELVYSFKAVSLIDPYGVRTNYLYANDQLSQINEAGGATGRWIKIFYLPDGNVDHIQGSDNRVVQYGYETFAGGVTVLTDVTYYGQQSLKAHYTYVGSSAYPLLKTADDPMYTGAMKKIHYHYSATGEEPDIALPHGFIVRESNWETDELVSKLEMVDANTRRETRGDGATRTFGYSNEGLLVTWTDFENVTMMKGYDSHSFVAGTIDGNQNLTSFTNEPHAGNVTMVTRASVDDVEPQDNEPSDTVIHFAYTNPLEPYYVQSTTDARGHPTIYDRDPTTHRVMQINYPDQSHEEFLYNAFGQITRHRRKNGYYEHLQYDPRGLLQIAWNPIANATIPADNGPEAKTRFTYYNSNEAWPDRVKSVTDANGYMTTLEYDSLNRGLVTKVTYADQKYRLSEYDTYGRLLWEENELRQRTNYEYDDYNRITHKKTPLPNGQQADTAYNYAPGPYVSARVRTAPTVTTVTKPPAIGSSPNPTIVTKYKYDNNLRLKEVTQLVSPTTPLTTQYNYDFAGNLKSVIDPRQHETTILYDAQNRRRTVTSPLVTVSANENTHYVTEWKYDAAGNVRRVIQPDGKQKVVEYDVMNRVWIDHAPIDPADPHERTVRYAYYDSGAVREVTDPNDNVTSYTYNARDLKQTVIYPHDAPSTDWVYDGVGKLLERPTVGGPRQLFTYDHRNRLTSMRWSNGVDSSDFEYDGAGRMTLAQNPYSTVSRHYDEGGRLTTEQQVFPTQPGAPIPAVQPLSVVSRKTHGQAVFDIPLPLVGEGGIECRHGGRAGEYQIVATFATAVTVDSVKVNSGIAELLSANLSGTQITINLRHVSTAQRLTVLLAGLSDGSHAGDLIVPMRVLIGDSSGDGVVKEDDLSQITDHSSESLSAANFRCDVDASDGIDADDEKIVAKFSGNGLPDAPGGVLSYEYDPDGKRKRVRITGTDYDLNYKYDGVGRLLLIQRNDSINSQFRYQYDDWSNVIYRYNYANGTWLHREFDEINRTKQEILHANRLVGNAAETYEFSHLHYTYDPVHRLKFIYREENGLTDAFDYNEAGELTDAQYGMQWNGHEWDMPNSPYLYRYEPAGNRQSVEHNGTTEIYSPNNLNQYDSVNGYQITNGTQHELRNYANVTYYYLNDGYLSRVTGNGDTYELGYDALGRRVKGTFNGQITRYVYDGAYAIVEYSATGQTVANTVYGLSPDEIIARNNGGGQFPLQDRLGSTIAVTGGNGTVLEQYRYDAFGTPTIMDGDGIVLEKGTQINNRFLFAGREWVARFDFYENRARAYHPGLGRFMSEDPLGFAGGDANLFRYCGNDPVNWRDPFGLYTWQFGLQFSGNIGPYAFAWGGGVAWDGSGNIAGYGSAYQAASGLGATIGLGVGGMRSDADTIFGLEGKFAETTATIGDEGEVTLNVFRGKDAAGKDVTGSGLFFGGGGGAGWSAGISNTGLSPHFNIFDLPGLRPAPPPGGSTSVDESSCPGCPTMPRVIVTGTFLNEGVPGYHDGVPLVPGYTSGYYGGAPGTVTGSAVGPWLLTIFGIPGGGAQWGEGSQRQYLQ